MNSDQSSSDSNSIRLMLAYLCIATEKDANLERKVAILDRFKLTDGEIAIVCQSAAQSIRNARQSLKKRGAKKNSK